MGAARIEVLTRAEPKLGRSWRTGAAFAEATRSVGIEGVRLSETDLVRA